MVKVCYSKWWGFHADRESLANMAAMEHSSPVTQRTAWHSVPSHNWRFLTHQIIQLSLSKPIYFVS